jgi:hypothetical protein
LGESDFEEEKFVVEKKEKIECLVDEKYEMFEF